MPRLGKTSDDHDPNDPWLARVAAAAFLARFATDETVASHQATLSAIFDRALQQANRELRNLRYDVMYDAHALAITGRLYLASRLQRAEDRRALLSAVSSNPASAAAALSRHPQAAKDIGDRTASLRHPHRTSGVRVPSAKALR